jgi:lysophospholipase L1-like esterase
MVRMFRHWISSILALAVGVALFFGSARAQVRVACIGNSITCCYHYPDSLQKLLRRGHSPQDTVQNEGVTTTTMLKPAYSNCSYWNNGKLAQLFAFKPTVVTIMLGTNDAKQGTGTVTGCGGSACYNNWKNKAQYTPAYYAMIDTINATLGYKPKIFCVFPPPAIDGNFICVSDTTFTKEMIPMIQAVAAARGLPTISCHNAGYKSVDSIHPTLQGVDSLAQWFYRGLTTVRMIAYPPSLAFTVKNGQTDTTGTTLIDSISNPSIAGTLDTIQVAHQTSWLGCGVTAASLNAQKVNCGLVLSALPTATGTYYDTITVSAANATPPSIRYIATLTVQQGSGTTARAGATTGFMVDIRQVSPRAIRVSLFNPGSFDISVMTTPGKIVAFRKVLGAGSTTVQLPAGHAAGAYIVRVRSSDNNRMAVRKIFAMAK